MSLHIIKNMELRKVGPAGSTFCLAAEVSLDHRKGNKSLPGMTGGAVKFNDMEDKIMARYRVLEAKCGVGAGGMACGPVSGPIVGEIKLADESGKEFYLCLAEVDGIPNWFKTDRSTIDEQLSDNGGPDLYNYLGDNYVDFGEYEDVFEDTEAEFYQACRYLIYLVRCERDQEEPFIRATAGKYLDEMEIPMSDLEEEYFEE